MGERGKKAHIDSSAAGTAITSMHAVSFSSQINYYEGYKSQPLCGSGRPAKASLQEGLVNWMIQLCDGNLAFPSWYKQKIHLYAWLIWECQPTLSLSRVTKRDANFRGPTKARFSNVFIMARRWWRMKNALHLCKKNHAAKPSLLPAQMSFHLELSAC